MGVSAADKAALILNLLGHELASKLFAGLSRRQQAAVLRSFAGPSVAFSETQVEEICKEFAGAVSNGSFSGGSILNVPRHSYAGVALPRGSRVNEICEDIPDWILTEHLKQQLDAVVSAVLGSLENARAGMLFRAMRAERQTTLLMSLSKERVLESSVLDELESDLEELRARSASGRYGQRVGGTQRALALVQALDPDVRQRILEEIEVREPALAKHIEGGLLSVERLSELLASHLAVLLAQLKDNDIGSFLRGESPRIQALYLAALSKRRREDIECLLAPEKKITQKQKSEACERLRMCAQRLKGEGKILFPWEESLVG